MVQLSEITLIDFCIAPIIAARLEIKRMVTYLSFKKFIFEPNNKLVFTVRMYTIEGCGVRSEMTPVHGVVWRNWE